MELQQLALIEFTAEFNPQHDIFYTLNGSNKAGYYLRNSGGDLCLTVVNLSDDDLESPVIVFDK